MSVFTRIRAFYIRHCEDYAAAFPGIRSYIEEKPIAKGLLETASALTAVLYASYAVLAVIGLILAKGSILFSVGWTEQLAAVVISVFITPFLIFLITTVVRDRINAPRPYERYDIVPIFPKNTKGHSLPSRHTACAFAVAFAWLSMFPPAGAVFLVFAVLIAVSRPLIGVHFPFDAAAGFVLALVIQLISWIVSGVIFA